VPSSCVGASRSALLIGKWEGVGKTKLADGRSAETYRVESRDRFTYSLDLSTDRGHRWNPRQTEMEFSRKEWVASRAV
jgi:hypothetical protein